MLTDNQLLHRQYLQSPIWKAKRLEALAYYGPVCNRCHEPGNDVHHRTYDRVGGRELMEDLEVLCRECHDAHHRVERASREGRRKRRRSIRKQAIFPYLTATHKRQLVQRFGLHSDNELSAAIMAERMPLMLEAARLLGYDQVAGSVLARQARAKRNAAKNLAAKRAKRRQRRNSSRVLFSTVTGPG